MNKIIQLSILFALTVVPKVHADQVKTTLELHDYKDIVLMSTKGSGKNAKVCFSLPDGTYNIAKVGSYVGRNNGRIVAIAKHYIDIVQLIPVNRGEWAESKFSWPVAENNAWHCG